MLKISVLGAGAWGTALANLAARGREPRSETAVTFYAREEAHVAEMAATGVNARRLPGVPLLSDVAPTADLAAAAEADVFLAVVPAQALRGVLELAPLIPEAWRAGRRLRQGHRTWNRTLSQRGRVRNAARSRRRRSSGPSFAQDVARGLPTAVTSRR